ncbi:GNAT family N-acetyltransferase [Thermosulfuriphilus ammonigenes]|uniref:GNAT family N-acetyltransferase n=1 Tax=Thermosulfuriphilus ammonigenes TaxID=1936021 RepID=A0A6G7PVK3_9BACT|nr:GNAT family N-acetyltransferase [Thermosulfuriphilus ammonigenes]MBA2848365.1 ribosomal protein S18 acetylase RimI-like enzyme [Thermosulfuriphilus ammonigenes]QIJ71478.1 GNAT family N-acetyltransferase [Thermosulfuriphilus ammonigenes]
MVSQAKEARLSFRRAQREDLGKIVELSKEAFAAYGPYGRIVARWFEEPTVATFVLEREEEFLGFGMIGPFIWFPWLPVAELMAIALIPQARGQGLGKVLLDMLEKEARKQRLLALRLHTGTGNRRAIALFRKAGYRTLRVIKTYYPSGLDALEMWKKLWSVSEPPS